MGYQSSLFNSRPPAGRRLRAFPVPDSGTMFVETDDGKQIETREKKALQARTEIESL